MCSYLSNQSIASYVVTKTIFCVGYLRYRVVAPSFRALNIPEQPATNNQQSNEAVMQLTELFTIHSDIDPAFLCQRILKF